MHFKKRLLPWKIHGYASACSCSFLEFSSRIELLIVRSHERQNELIPVWDFKTTWKQVLFTWSFILAAFQNDPILWWTCVCISFWVVYKYILSPKMKFHFYQSDQCEIHTHIEFQTHMLMKCNIKQVCAYSFCFG